MQSWQRQPRLSGTCIILIKSIMPLLGTACPMYMYTWFPNTRADFSGGEAFHDDVEKVLLSEEEYQEMAKALREEIRKPA